MFQYRHYEDGLLQVKSWYMIWVIIVIIPIGLIIIESGMNLNWTFMAAQVFVAPFIVSLFLTIAWAGATGIGLIAGRCVLSGATTPHFLPSLTHPACVLFNKNIHCLF